MATFDGPRLIADIGGTYARFALEASPGVFSQQALLRCADHANVQSALRAYLATVPQARVVHAGLAVATPIEGDQVGLTNYHWTFSIDQVRQQLALDTLLVVNDFTALAMSLPRLGAAGVRQVGGGRAVGKSVMGLLGSGSGLGVSGLIPAGDGWVSLGSEGGHTSFSPRDERELAVLRHAWREFEHVSCERLLSGPGLALMYRALAEHAGAPPRALAAADITRCALDGSDPVAVQTLDVFCAVLGTAAGNLALTLGATGGIYIGGGIVPRLGPWFDSSRFRARFEDKGRLQRYLAAIPSFVITHDEATAIGVSAILDSQLKARRVAPGTTILGQIQRACGELSPAELRVAEHVLAQPRGVINQPIADIAKAAQVSQPTVIRFCRSLGCEGLSDFKLRLASGLSGTLPISHVQVTNDDSTVELGAKVLGNTASAILQLRGQLNREMIERSIGLLAGAAAVEICTVGPYSAVALDAQYKLLRFGIRAGAHADPGLQLLAVGVLGPGDVAVIISPSGRLPELLTVADRARERGAAVVAITASQSPLARQADALLAVDQADEAATQVPMIGRILQLLMVDILTVGVAVRRQADTGPAVRTADATGAAGLVDLAAPAPAAGGNLAAPTLAHLHLQRP